MANPAPLTPTEIAHLAKECSKHGYGGMGGGGSYTLEIGGDGYDRRGTYYEVTHEDYYLITSLSHYLDMLVALRKIELPQHCDYLIEQGKEIGLHHLIQETALTVEKLRLFISQLNNIVYELESATKRTDVEF